MLNAGHAASDSSASDEATRLELYLQKQLEEDIARIFDESIYTDVEVVCGKLKLLTHSCILKARTNTFYNKLDAILHVNIGRDTFDEIYSFVSDAYTECDITSQEIEILIFLKSKIFTNTNTLLESKKNKDELEEIDVFLTPNCASPYKEKKVQEISCLSPSTELTKEYYALVHIDGNLFEQELIEQDALSDAFQTIKKSQDKFPNKTLQRNKPTSLSLIPNHLYKTTKHSNYCDINNKIVHDTVALTNDRVTEKKVNNNTLWESSKIINFNKFPADEPHSDKILDPAYSPDSLITDDPSSSSDYLSAAYASSPALESSGCLAQINAEDNSTKMDTILKSSDSGLENTGLLESLSQKDVTLTDLSLSEGTLQDLKIEETNYSHESPSSPEAEDSGNGPKQKNSYDIGYGKSSKEEKQRHNEEIVILESSSVSSETGSWESVFPPKITDKEICEKFIRNERHFVNQDDNVSEKSVSDRIADHRNVEKLLNISTCFIDASGLVDEDQMPANLQYQNDEENINPIMRCSTVNRLDISPGDWSESNDNEDSLEQPGEKESDSIQKDCSPTIFEITPITEDSLSKCDVYESKNVFETNIVSTYQPQKPNSLSSSTVYMGTTPHNSIMLLNSSPFKQYESEESETDRTVVSQENFTNFRHTPKTGTQNSSPSVQRKVENISKATDACSSQENDNLPKSPKSATGLSWVVDMSDVNSKALDMVKDISNQNSTIKIPLDRACESLKNEIKSISNEKNCKSRGSIDSDISEKSSHKFYIDLSTLPDPLPPEKPSNSEDNIEKKNIFSMYIDLGDNSSRKEMPARLSSSLNVKKQTNDSKIFARPNKMSKIVSEENTFKTSKPSNKINVSAAFETYEALCNDPNLSISEIIAIRDNSGQKKATNKTKDMSSEQRCNMDESKDLTLVATPINKTLVEPINEQESDLFVKLSDLDKPKQKSDILKQEKIDVRMTRSIPEEKILSTSKDTDIMHSFHSENALSLNRLFPNLKNEISESMPTSLTERREIRPPPAESQSMQIIRIDDTSNVFTPNVSKVSNCCCQSMCKCKESLMDNSAVKNTDKTTSRLIRNCQSRLGQDLLRMFIEEIAPDVTIEVSGKRIKAHKCILSSRCQYFAGILSGGWVESSGNVINLPPFSYNGVYFALCHIYSGVSEIPESVSIVELATIADMLGLEGLKEAIMFTLKAKYCHFFHKPCHVCIAGVLECFPLSSAYGLDNLYRKCLKWITKYFTKVWPTKAFATLPKELVDKCYQEHIVNLSIDNLLDTVYGCSVIEASLQNSRWAEIVARMCRRLLNAAAHYAAPRLFAIVDKISTVTEAPHFPIKQTLDECIIAAIACAPPEETCRAYALLSYTVRENHGKPPEPNNLLYTHASSWHYHCEVALVRAAPKVVCTQAFKVMPADCRKRLRELGCIMYGPQAIPLPTSVHQDKKTHRISYQNKPKTTITTNSTTRNLDMEKVRSSFVPYKPKPVAIPESKERISSTSELKYNKNINNKNNVPAVRTTKAQEKRAIFNKIKTQSQERAIPRKPSAVRPSAFVNTKPRYLEPRQCREREKKTSTKKFVNKMVSSSDSSCNSSPNQCKRTSRLTSNLMLERKTLDMSQDSLSTSRLLTSEPSTDSLSEKYATFTIAKHEVEGSVESLSSKSQVSSVTGLVNMYKAPDLKSNKIPVASSSSCTGAYRKTRICERKVSESLMCATKSSSAKMVPRVTKEPQVKPCKQQQKQSPKISNPSVPTLKRSGTFLKDEPMFADKRNIDKSP